MGTATKKVKRIWPVIIICLLWLAFAAPYFLRGKIPFPSDYLVSFFAPWNATSGIPVKNNAMPDVISQIFPWKKLTIDTWKSGQIPLWDPYSFSGTPLAANYQSAVFSPLNLLFFILPFIDAWSFLILLQPLVAALGTYMLLRRLSRSRLGSTIGAIAFMFCGFMTTWMAYGTLGWAIAFLPWALWAVKTDFIRKSKLSRIILTVSVICSFLSGHFQISIYLFAAVTGFIAFETYVTRQYLKGLTLFAYSLLGLCLASPQLFLTLDAYRASTRGLEFPKIEVIPWNYIITVLAPDIYGNPVTRNDWFGHYAEWSSYVGVIPLIFALFASFRKLKGEKLYFVLLGVIAILLAYPTPLNDLLFRLHIPAISTSAASRIIVLFSFALCVLSSFGIDEVRERWKSGKKVYPMIFSSVSLVILGLVWILLFSGRMIPVSQLTVAKRNLVLPTGFVVLALCLLIAGFVRKKFAVLGISTAFLLLTVFDSYRFVTKWMPFESREYIYPQMKSLNFLSSVVGYDRVFGNIGNEVGGMFQLSLVEGYDALYQGRYAEFINATSTGKPMPGGRSVVQFDKQGKYKTEALQLLGVRYIYQRVSDGRNVWAFPYWEYLGDSSMKQLYHDETYDIYEFTRAYPRAFLASSYVVKSGNSQIIQTLFSKDFNSRNTLVLEEKPMTDPKEGSGSAEITSYQSNRVTIRTDSSVPKLLFLSDVFDPGWHSTIDGKETAIYRADYDFRAVSVPAGIHTVQFSYFPSSFKIGVFLAGFATLIVIGITVL